MLMTEKNYKQYRMFFVAVITICFMAPIIEYFRIPGGWLIAGAWFGWSAYQGFLKANAIARVNHEFELSHLSSSYKPKYRLKDLELLGFDYESLRNEIEDEAVETLADLERKYHDIIEEKDVEHDLLMFTKDDKGYKQ